MIAYETARRIAVKFFEEQKLEDLAKMVKEGKCIGSIFRATFEKVGKGRVIELYRQLPRQLRYFFLRQVWTNDKDADDKLISIDKQFKNIRRSSRPERMKDFSKYMIELEEVWMNYMREA